MADAAADAADAEDAGLAPAFLPPPALPLPPLRSSSPDSAAAPFARPGLLLAAGPARALPPTLRSVGAPVASAAAAVDAELVVAALPGRLVALAGAAALAKGPPPVSDLAVAFFLLLVPFSPSSDALRFWPALASCWPVRSSFREWHLGHLIWKRTLALL